MTSIEQSPNSERFTGSNNLIPVSDTSAPSSAVQTTTTTPNTLGDPNNPLPPTPRPMQPLPGAALDVNAFPPERGQLIRAAKLSADLSVNDAQPIRLS